MRIQQRLLIGSGVRRTLMMAAVALLLMAGIGAVSSINAHAEACPNETLRAQQPHASTLPDCRAYEQVSPDDKTGVDAAGAAGLTQAAPAGEGVGFFSVEPFPETTGSGNYPSYLSRRALTGDGWATEGIEALVSSGALERIVGVTEDLSKTIIEVASEQVQPCEPALTVCATDEISNDYIRDNTTGTFQLLASQPRGVEVAFVDATPGASRILFETTVDLTGTAPPGDNLYEWNETKPADKRITLAGILTGGSATAKGSFAGPGGPEVTGVAGVHGGAVGHFYTAHTISQDGSRIFFSDAETGRIYMREPQAEPAVTIPISPGSAYWRAATPDGRYVFYTEGEELYRYDTETKTATPLTSGAEGVLGTLGVSDDGSYAYFVARGKLAAATNTDANGEQPLTTAQENEEFDNTQGNKDNLYEWHAGATIFIARLQGPTNGNTRDEADWRGYFTTEGEATGPAGGARASRVTPDGTSSLFFSTVNATGYDSHGKTEIYLLDGTRPPSPTNPRCVSCNPLSSTPTGETRLTDANGAIEGTPRAHAFLTQNLSGDASRVFFQTNEALVPEDQNATLDVYEWERAGAGACEAGTAGFTESNGGCLYLISTGKSPQQSYFGDASADGSNVFFFTRQSLVSQDQDENSDLYDARVEGGIPAQNPPPPREPCMKETACHETFPGTPPALGSPASVTLPAPGNLAPPRPKPKTAAQLKAEKLAKALEACRSKSRSKRKRCEAAARKRYGTKSKPKGKKSTRGGGHS